MSNKPWDSRRQILCSVLKSLRLKSGLTQQRLSELLGRPQSYVSKYENGERKLDFVEVMEVCETLDVMPEELVRLYFEKVD